MSNQSAGSGKPSFLSKHGGKSLAILSGVVAGGSVLVVDSVNPPNFQKLLESFDTFLTADLFIGLSTINIAVFAFLLPRFLQEADEMDTGQSRGFKVGDKRLVSLFDLGRALRHLLASFAFSLLGVANSLAFDGLMEYKPPEQQDAGLTPQLVNLVGPWADLAECATSSGLLASSLVFLGLGVRALITALNRYDKLKPST
jgi:hypothetical protein